MMQIKTFSKGKIMQIFTPLYQVSETSFIDNADDHPTTIVIESKK